MATQPPSKQPDIRAVTVHNAEVPFQFHGKTSITSFVIQAVGDNLFYVGLIPGSTHDPTNRWTVKSGEQIRFDDVNFTPPEDALYLRVVGDETLIEIWYWG